MKAPELLKAGKLISAILSCPVSIKIGLVWSLWFDKAGDLFPKSSSMKMFLNYAHNCIFLVDE